VVRPGAVGYERPWIPSTKVKAKLTNRRELVRQRYGLSWRPHCGATEPRENGALEAHPATLAGEEAIEGAQRELGSHVAVAERSLEREKPLHFTSQWP
jgi:hypothetical protein